MSTASEPLPYVGVCWHLPPHDLDARLSRFARRHRLRLQGVIVANHPAHGETPRLQTAEVLRGSNTFLDFSGYWEGLQRLRDLDATAASRPVLFLNDSLFTKHASDAVLRRVLSLARLLEQLELAAIAGKADPYRALCLRNPWSGDTRYVSSFCFLLNRQAQPFLLELPQAGIDDAVADGRPLAAADWGARLDPRLREAIRAQLLYEGSPYRWRTDFDPASALTTRKACCVYFEHRLSGAIASRGALVPINSGLRSHLELYGREALAQALGALRRRRS